MNRKTGKAIATVLAGTIAFGGLMYCARNASQTPVSAQKSVVQTVHLPHGFEYVMSAKGPVIAENTFHKVSKSYTTAADAGMPAPDIEQHSVTTTAPPVDQSVVGVSQASHDDHVDMYHSHQADQARAAAQVQTDAPAQTADKPDQHIVATPYITNLSAENLRFKTRHPYIGQTIVEIQEGDVKAFIPVGLHHDLKKGRARKTIDEMVKNGVVTERGVMATPYTDFGFKANRNEILQVPINGNVVMHQPEGTSIRLSQRYNAPEVNRIVGDNVISESEKQQLGDRIVVFEVAGSNSYLLPVQVSPEAKMPPATSTKPTVKQLAPAIESGYTAAQQAPAMRQVPVSAASNTWRSNSLEKRAVSSEMQHFTAYDPGSVDKTSSTVTRVAASTEVGYSTNSTVTRIEPSGFVGLRSSLPSGYGLLGTTYKPVLIQDAPTVPDWNKVVPVTRIPAYK